MRFALTVVRGPALAWRLGLTLLVVALPGHAGPPPALSLSPDTVVDGASAKAALDAIDSARRQLAAERPALQDACHRRVLVNACLADLDEQRRGQESRLKVLEVRAKTALREDRAARAHAAEAERQQQREESAGERAAREEASRQEREERQERAQERAGARPAQEAGHAARGERWEIRNRAREEDRSRRERDREQREREAPERAAANAERLEQHEAQRRERRARLQEREPKDPSR
jgi:hypothetical protein